jgi:glycosyltransferase involved in cell wall biosynthesis
MSVIYNGIGKLKLLSKSAARVELFGEKATEIMTKKPLVIGTIAELHKNKGLSYALEGLAQLKKQSAQPFIFVVIGEGEERARLEAEREALGLTDSVFFVGFKTDASALLSAFDIFLFTSTKEGFPYAILEAGNAGLPVVATAVGGIPEVIDDMRSGILIQSKNPGEVARALSYLIEHKERREEFGLAIKERIEGRFNIETMTKETLALYEQS